MNVVEGIKFAAKHRQITQIIGIFMRFFAVLLPVFLPWNKGVFLSFAQFSATVFTKYNAKVTFVLKQALVSPSDHSQMVIDALGYLLDENLKAELSRRVHGQNSRAYKSCHFGKQMRKESRIFRFGRRVARKGTHGERDSTRQSLSPRDCYWRALSIS